MADNTPENPTRRNRAASPSEPEPPAADDAVSFLEKQLAQEAPGMDPGLRKSLARLGSAIAKKAAEKPVESEPAAKEEPQSAEVIPLAFWGEDYRAAPNAIFRSALFPALRANDKEVRRYLEEEEIFCVAGLKIFFTGKQFDQNDLDVYLEILNRAQSFPLGTPIRFSAHALLKALGLPTGGSNHARVHSVLIRLCGGVIDATDHGKRYFGQLLHGGIRDELTQNYIVNINPDFALLFGPRMWGKVDLAQRRALGRNPTAKALHAYYSSHINPAAHHIETLAKLAGLTDSNPRQAKATIIKAHEAMKEAGFLNGYEVRGNTIKIDPNPSPSQQRAIALQAAKSKPRRRNAPTPVGELLPDPPRPKGKK